MLQLVFLMWRSTGRPHDPSFNLMRSGKLMFNKVDAARHEPKAHNCRCFSIRRTLFHPISLDATYIVNHSILLQQLHHGFEQFSRIEHGLGLRCSHHRCRLEWNIFFDTHEEARIESENLGGRRRRGRNLVLVNWVYRTENLVWSDRLSGIAIQELGSILRVTPTVSLLINQYWKNGTGRSTFRHNPRP